MNKETKTFENFPFSTIFIANSFTIAIYLIGIYFLLQFHVIYAVLYFIYIILLETYIYKEGCVSCYYYGKFCAFGRGKLAPLFFKKDDPAKFCKKEVNWLKMIPQVILVVIPIIAGIILLVKSFSWFILILVLIPPASWFFANPIIYGKLACPYCKQGAICCPALELFNKKNKNK